MRYRDIIPPKPIQINVAGLSAIYNPFIRSPWMTQPIARDDVRKAIKDERTSADHHDALRRNSVIGLEHLDYDFHVRRIAYLVIHPSSDPIDIVPTALGTFTMEDGYHRLAAAIYRGDDTIPANVGGTEDEVRVWLGL